MVNQFPPIKLDTNSKSSTDFNPAVRTFGRRFFADQTISEVLLEFLLVATSPKKIGEQHTSVGSYFPNRESLRCWPEFEPLRYSPKARLNLKLFSFLSASKLETRHKSHRQQYLILMSEMKSSENLNVSDSINPDDILKTLENLFLGFQSVGGQRTWCAQAFLPIAENMLAAETLWNETQARRDEVSDWESVLQRFTRYFSYDQHRFLARGGELLYLQICNCFRQDTETVESWLGELGWYSANERDPVELQKQVEVAITEVFRATPDTINKLATFIDTGVDESTSRETDFTNGLPRYSTCGWCPPESWKEGLFFAIELTRICKAVIDPIERIELLEIACAMQMLRSLCAQSVRYTRDENDSESHFAGPLGYVWAISDPAGQHNAVKQISRRNVNAIQRLIHDAIRHPDILNDYKSDAERSNAYREADRRYGHKLFLTVAKRLGLIVPRQGSGARFVLNERVLRYLVLSTIRPGERVTYDSFKQLLYTHHGLAVDESLIGRSCRWSGTTQLTTLGGNVDRWLLEMLDASGMLIRLSDSCSLVENPFGNGVAKV